ncbi:hypothetical protein AGMMS49942_29820 [Spirochaetia bacterium]|nr:hypothetical protein AGMMS49942_29820 [Spirochaetia bacterium]
MLALLMAAFVFVSCESPEAAEGLVGPAGPAGPTGPVSTTRGPQGVEGYTPAASLLAVKALFDANVSKVYHDGTADTDVTVLSIPNGKTLLIPVSVTLGGSGAGIQVENGGTLLISGTLTPDTKGVEVESGGTLTVQAGGALVVDSTKKLVVKTGARVTIQSDGALIATTTFGVAGADGDVIAKNIGSLAKISGAAQSLLAGNITFDTGSWAGSTAIDTAWAVGTGNVISVAAVTQTSGLGGAAIPSGGGKVRLYAGTNNLAAALSVPANITLIVPPGTAIGTVNGGAAYDLTVLGTVQGGGIVITGAGSGVVTTTASSAPVSLAVSGAGIGVLSIGIASSVAVPAGASIVVGGTDGITLGEGAYKSTVAASTITAIANGGATLFIGNGATFQVGIVSGGKGDLVVGNKSAVTYGSSTPALFTASQTAGYATVWLKAGAKLAADNTNGIKLSDGQLGTASGSTLPASSAGFVNASNVLAADVKLQNTVTPNWIAGTF